MRLLIPKSMHNVSYLLMAKVTIAYVQGLSHFLDMEVCTPQTQVEILSMMHMHLDIQLWFLYSD